MLAMNWKSKSLNRAQFEQIFTKLREHKQLETANTEFSIVIEYYHGTSVYFHVASIQTISKANQLPFFLCPLSLK